MFLHTCGIKRLLFPSRLRTHHHPIRLLTLNKTTEAVVLRPIRVQGIPTRTSTSKYFRSSPTISLSLSNQELINPLSATTVARTTTTAAEVARTTTAAATSDVTTAAAEVVATSRRTTIAGTTTLETAAAAAEVTTEATRTEDPRATTTVGRSPRAAKRVPEVVAAAAAAVVAGTTTATDAEETVDGEDPTRTPTMATTRRCCRGTRAWSRNCSDRPTPESTSTSTRIFRWRRPAPMCRRTSIALRMSS